MKLQNMAVIFIIIVIPIILVVSYYISMQVDTINMQTSYNTKLLASTKEAIEAFEINTVEWNEAYSETADSKRRDIMASINTFTASFANSIGVGGASKETILAYVPAIAYTLYDGYYIYSPAETKVTIKDNKGVTVFVKQNLVNYGSDSGRAITFSDNKYNSDNEGKILYEYDSEKGGSPDGDYNGQAFTLNSAYAKTTYSHILKPFTAYSARYKTGNGLDDTDITVNYTLDNYITIYGKVDGNYEKKSGYLIDTKGIEISEEKYEIVKVDGNIIGPETLTEKIWYEGLSEPTSFTYIYEAENNTKVYFDETTPFQVSSTGVRTDLSKLSSVKYKKLSIYNGDDSCIEIYQALNDSKDGTISKGKWYIKKDSTVEAKDYGQRNTISLKNDVSAINYYVESYAFSKWVYKELSNIKVEDMQSQTEHITITGDIFNEQGIEDEDSIFNLHKREIIKQAVISNLNQSITSYSRNSEGEFQLPILSETDWDQILSNVSITTFVQGIPIGMKYYNNYAIATSTSNKEYVDPNEIYLNTSGDTYYHLPYCNKLNSGGNLIGYRSIDYKLKSYGEEENTGYYYKHDNIGNEECYYCLVQRSLYEETPDLNKVTAYQTALAREKYAARKTVGLNIELATLGEYTFDKEYYYSTSPNGTIEIVKSGTYKITLVAGGGGGPAYRNTMERVGGGSGEIITTEVNLNEGTTYSYTLGKPGTVAGDAIDVSKSIIDSIEKIIMGNTGILAGIRDLIYFADDTGTAGQGGNSTFEGVDIDKIEAVGGQGGGYKRTYQEAGDSEENPGSYEESNLANELELEELRDLISEILRIDIDIPLYRGIGGVNSVESIYGTTNAGSGGDFGQNGVGGYLRITYIGE